MVEVFCLLGGIALLAWFLSWPFRGLPSSLEKIREEGALKAKEGAIRAKPEQDRTADEREFLVMREGGRKAMQDFRWTLIIGILVVLAFTWLWNLLTR